MTQSHYEESASPADTSDDLVAELDDATERDATSELDEPVEPAEATEAGEPAESDEATDADEVTADPAEPTESDEAAPAADPRVRDAVRRLDDLSDLPPADHVEVYEAVHSSLQESLAEASRQADESPPDDSSPS